MMAKRKTKNPFTILRGKKGIAILVAIFTVMLVSFIAIEISEDATVEYLVASNEVNRLKAYYAAKAGIEISLLRIYLYQQAVSNFGDKAPQTLLDSIWSMPFAWPPVLPKEAGEMDRDAFNKVTKESLMDAQYLATISSEGSKIDLNDLNSPSKTLTESTKAQLQQIIASRLEEDDDWARDNRDLRPEEIVNNIVDWITPGDESSGGGDKRSKYRDLPEGYPPGTAFKTLEELHMVKDVTDEIYSLLASRVTVHGIKAIQVNHASADVLKSLDPQMTKEVVEEIVKRRSDPAQGPFKDDKDFYGFLGTQVPDVKKIEERKIPLVFTEENNFTVRSTGLAGKSTREIIAIVYDFDKVKTRLTKLVAAEKATPTPTPGAPGNPATPSAPDPGNPATPSAPAKPPGKPRIVQWLES